MLWFLPVFFDLAAQTVDIDHNGIVINGDGGSPYLLVDHIFCIYLARMLNKK